MESKDLITLENRLRCQDCSYKWMSCKLRTQLEDQLIYGVCRDISDAKQTEKALRVTAIEQTKVYNQNRITVQTA